jgi:hypothetical protein
MVRKVATGSGANVSGRRELSFVPVAGESLQFVPENDGS